jgi:hypothetical protein
MKYKESNVLCQITLETSQWKTLCKSWVWNTPCPKFFLP